MRWVKENILKWLVRMRMDMSQKFSITLKQKVDGQIQVTRIRIPKEILDEQPFLKQQIKTQMESMLKMSNIKVMGDKGIIEYD
tara:strand:+ start:32 stop:280 length:249 start_codon:yes stop_codon:yes gene_type:complete